MAVNIKRSSISDNGTAFRAPVTADINIEDSNVDRNDIAFDLFLTPESFVRAGLPVDTPPQLVKELATSIKASGSEVTQAATADALPNSSLWKWIEKKLGAAASVATIAAAVWSILSQLGDGS